MAALRGEATIICYLQSAIKTTTLVLLLSLSASSTALTQAQTFVPKPEPVASYTMDVRLDPQAKTVAGEQRISYRNPSPDTLNELWLRLYLKAFSSIDTLWMREGGGQLRGDQADPANLGDITLEALTLADGTDLLANATLSDTLVRVPLPQPLGPNETVELSARWTSKLPRVFARTGYGGANDDFFMVGQWYPKLAVYDRGRWDTEPWHANSEFFHDFGNYDVALTLPSAFVVAGAGVSIGTTEHADGTTTHRFRSEGVTDYAFAASPDFLTRTGSANIATGPVTVSVYYLPEHESIVDEYMRAATGSLEAFSEWFGPYPHPQMTVVDVPDNASGAGGMEYPTLVTAGALGGIVGGPAYVTAHEIAHNWWPMQTATNEGREPWLDEGLSEYSGGRYNAEAGDVIGFPPVLMPALAFERQSYAVNPRVAATRPAWEYQGIGYATGVYQKTALALWSLERTVGRDRMHRALAVYLERYRYRHPTGDDFRATMREQLGTEATDWFFAFLDGEGLIDYTLARADSDNGSATVVVRREGEAVAPVEVVATFDDGSTQTQRWDGAATETTLTFQSNAPLRAAAIDPDFKIVAELDRLDNGLTLEPQRAAQAQLGARLGFWSQLLVQIVGQFG
jgi:hypothetical protein